MILEDCWNPEQWISFVKDLVPIGHEISTYDARHVRNNIDDYLIVINKK